MNLFEDNIVLYIFAIISHCGDGPDCMNTYRLSYIANTNAADVMAIQDARTPAAMVLTYFAQNILVSA